MKILGISGSLRADSLNTQLLRLAADELPSGIELEVYDGLAGIPPYDQDVEEDVPGPVAELAEAIRDADAVLFASPEYNGSVPGQLKNAIDWVSRQPAGAPLRGKAVAVLGTSPGQFGGAWGQAELRKVLGIVGARVVPAELAIAKGHQRLAEPDEPLLEQLRSFVDGLVAVVEQPVAA